MQYFYDLTPKEEEVLYAIVNNTKGKKNKDLAKDLHIKETTLNTHILHIFQKTETNSQIELIIKFYKGERMETIKTKEILDILQDINCTTLIRYLNNFRFTKFRATYTTGVKSKYYLVSDFLNILYTLLLAKKKEKAAENLKNKFNFVNRIEWEDFICKT
jgi:DNA-binding CsgD family transcriptional regulator